MTCGTGGRSSALVCWLATTGWGSKGELKKRWSIRMEGGDITQNTYYMLASWLVNCFYPQLSNVGFAVTNRDTVRLSSLPQVTCWYESWNQNWAQMSKVSHLWRPILPVSSPDSKVSEVSPRQAWGGEVGEKRKQGSKKKRKEKQTASWFKYKPKHSKIKLAELTQSRV